MLGLWPTSVMLNQLIIRLSLSATARWGSLHCCLDAAVNVVSDWILLMDLSWSKGRNLNGHFNEEDDSKHWITATDLEGHRAQLD